VIRLTAGFCGCHRYTSETARRKRPSLMLREWTSSRNRLFVLSSIERLGQVSVVHNKQETFANHRGLFPTRCSPDAARDHSRGCICNILTDSGGLIRCKY